MVRSVLFVTLFLLLVPPPRTLGQAPPVQTAQWIQGDLDDWLAGSFTNTYVEGSVLRLQPGHVGGSFESTPYQATFGFNAAIVETVVQATAAQTLTIDLRTSVDGQTWTEWQPAPTGSQANNQRISAFVAFRPFTSWLQYRAHFATTTDSPALDEIKISYVSSTAGPALVDLVGRMPLAGPTTLTQTPQAVARSSWSGQPRAVVLERQRPRRIELAQVLVPVDDPNSAATLRAYRWVVSNVYKQPDLPFHYLVNGSGIIFEGQGSATVRLPDENADVVRIALLADADREGISEATQASLSGLLAWLCEAYSLEPSVIDAAPGAPQALRDLVPELRNNTDRAIVRWQQFWAEGSPANGVERLVILNPQRSEVNATLIGYTATGEERRSLVVPPQRRIDVTLNTAFPNAEVLGLAVLADRPLQAERTQIVGREISSSVGVAKPARTWYWPAGETTAEAQSYLLLVNPQASTAEALLTFYGEATGPVTKTITISPRVRTTVLLNDLAPGDDWGLKLVATQPVVAERSQFKANGAATIDAGSTQLSRRWLFAEGTTTAGFTTTLHLLNPWPQPLTVALQVLSEDGTTVSRRYTIESTSRLTVALNEVVPDLPFALDLQAERPIVAAREMLAGSGQALSIGVGAPAPATRWIFAEGSTAPPAEQFLLLANPNRAAATVEVAYLLADGTTELRTHTMPPTSRLSIAANADVPGQPVLSTVITADRAVVAERTIFVNGPDGLGGETSLGVSGP